MTGVKADCQESPPAASNGKSVEDFEDTNTFIFSQCPLLYLFWDWFAGEGKPHFAQPVSFAGSPWIQC